MKRIAVPVLLTLLAIGQLAAQGYKYYPITIPTRDGKSLAADLYATDTTRRKPTILVQTPYNKNFYRLAVNIPPEAGGTPFPYDSAHYNYVVLDWRGFFGSTDAATGAGMYDRGLDGYDAVEWIAAQPWSDTKVGTWGASALGEIQFMTAKHHPPHLVCSVPLVKDYKTKYSDFYYGGDFRKEHVESEQALGFLSTTLILSHPTSDGVWTVVETANSYADSINVPMLLITGWYDHFPDDVIRAFYDLRNSSAPAVRGTHKLIIGPWMHSGVGNATQGVLSYPNSAHVSDTAALRFFDYYIRNIANDYPNDPPIRYYQMGRNEWRTTTDWYGICGRADTATFYLGAGGVLSKAIPDESHPADTIIYDPRNPSPTYGGARLVPFGVNVAQGPQDLRDTVENRGDVLVYSTPPLDEDMEITGGVHVDLAIRSNRTDTDFGVRLCDVYPDGRSIILTQGIRRARFREGFRPQDTALMVPGEIYGVPIDLQNIALTVLKGHRLRIDITSSNYPQYELNLNNGGAMYTAGDTLIAVNRVYHSDSFPSQVTMPVARTSGVTREIREVAGIALEGITPNPFTGTATINYSLATAAHASVKVYNLLGREVATVFDGDAGPGRHTLAFDAAGLPAGNYLCRLRVGDVVRTCGMGVVGR